MEITAGFFNWLADFFVASVSQEYAGGFDRDVFFRMFARVRAGRAVFEAGGLGNWLFERFHFAGADETSGGREAG